MIYPILVGSGILFWIILILCFASTSYYVEKERGVSAFLILLALFIGLTAFSTVNPLYWIATRWVEILIAAAAYVIMGVLYVVYYRYPKFTRQRVADYNKNKSMYEKDYQTFLSSHGGNMLYSEYLEEYKDMPPMPWKHKVDITFWMSWWVFSLSWTILWKPFELVKDLYNWIYEQIGNTLANVARRIFRKMVGDVDAKFAPNKDAQ